MGAAFPELARAEPLIEETLRSEETRFQATLERGLRLLDDELARLPDGAAAAGRAPPSGSTTPTASRSTSPRTRCASRAAASTSPASTRRWPSRRPRPAPPGPAPARPPTRRSGSTSPRRHGPTEFLGYDTETAEGEVLALVVGGRPVETADGRHRGAGRAEPDARSTPSPAARSATPAALRTDRAPRRDHRRPQEGRPLRPSRPRRGGRRSPAAPPPSSRSTTTGAPRSAPTTRRPTSCTRRCAAPSATTSPSAAAWSRPTGCASTSPTRRR